MRLFLLVATCLGAFVGAAPARADFGPLDCHGELALVLESHEPAMAPGGDAVAPDRGDPPARTLAYCRAGVDPQCTPLAPAPDAPGSSDPAPMLRFLPPIGAFAFAPAVGELRSRSPRPARADVVAFELARRLDRPPTAA